MYILGSSVTAALQHCSPTNVTVQLQDSLQSPPESRLRVVSPNGSLMMWQFEKKNSVVLDMHIL